MVMMGSRLELDRHEAFVYEGRRTAIVPPPVVLSSTRPSSSPIQPLKLLPPITIDPSNGSIIFSFEQIVKEGFFEDFVKDRTGCTYLQQHFPEEGTEIRKVVYGEVIAKEKLFCDMSKDVFANFFAQKLAENATEQEKHLLSEYIRGSVYGLCMNRYSCRVVQKIVEYFPDRLRLSLVRELKGKDLVAMCTDQNANHVVQKILNVLPLSEWHFIMDSLLVGPSFVETVENKYGCRVIQLAIELLSSPPGSSNHCHGGAVAMESSGNRMERHRLLSMTMDKLMGACEKFSMNEYANYVVQHVLTSRDLAVYRDKIIENCLLCHLLSMGQEKYASHVVEKAMENAPPVLLKEIMNEIFDGYVPHPETHKDALDILLLHQYGNYVIQCMINICKSSTSQADEGLRNAWLARLQQRISKHSAHLARYSSGKKILEMLNMMPVDRSNSFNGGSESQRSGGVSLSLSRGSQHSSSHLHLDVSTGSEGGGGGGGGLFNTPRRQPHQQQQQRATRGYRNTPWKQNRGGGGGGIQQGQQRFQGGGGHRSYQQQQQHQNLPPPQFNIFSPRARRGEPCFLQGPPHNSSINNNSPSRLASPRVPFHFR